MSDRHEKIPIIGVFQQTLHTPLSLGVLQAYARAYKSGVLLNNYDFLPKFYSNMRELVLLARKYSRPIFLFSDYLWNSDYHLEISAVLKRINPDALMIHGGPDVPQRPEHAEAYMRKHCHIDICVQGEGEVTLSEVLEAFSGESSYANKVVLLSRVNGLSFLEEGVYHQTPERARVKDLDEFPSPYLTGIFDTPQRSKWHFGVLETNRGCPYGCTFCDWGILQKVRRFDLQRVKDEITWMGKNKNEVIYLSDANFGMFPRDVEIAKHLAETKQHYGYPKQLFTNYAKNATGRILEIVTIMQEAELSVEGVVSVQTQDPQTLEVIDRSNIKTERYRELLQEFKSKNIAVSVDLMLGLPGQTLESYKKDLQYFFNEKALVKSYDTQLLTNSPMAHPEYMDKHKIKVDKHNYVEACASFTHNDYKRMHRLYELFHASVMFGVLKYFFYHLHMEYDIRATTFLDKLSQVLDDALPLNFPVMRDTFALFLSKTDIRFQAFNYKYELLFVPWKEFFHEVAVFTEHYFNIERNAQWDVLFKLQRALIPNIFSRYPLKVPLEHDVVAYLSQCKDRVMHKDEIENYKSLGDFGPTELEISDPQKLSTLSLVFRACYDIHSIPFELDSDLMTYEKHQHFAFGGEDGTLWFRFKQILSGLSLTFRVFFFRKEYALLNLLRRS